MVPSINSMNKVVMDMYLGDYSHLDMGEIGRAVMDWYAISLERGLEMRSQLPPALFVDCSQQEFVDDPLTVIQRIYDTFEMELSGESRAVLASHVRANPKGKHGRHEYNLEEYGLTRDMIDQRFAFYTSNQRWPIST